jgi:hypothetical protein
MNCRQTTLRSGVARMQVLIYAVYTKSADISLTKLGLEEPDL